MRASGVWEDLEDSGFWVRCPDRLQDTDTGKIQESARPQDQPTRMTLFCDGTKPAVGRAALESF